MPIKAIIIDDEKNARENLRGVLARFCPKVQVLGEGKSALDGINQIECLKPDLVFLDIEMPGGNGFEVLKHFSKPNFGVIFVTAYDHYAIEAIRFSAIDYILKPINVDELKTAIQRFETRKQVQQELLLQQFLKNNNKPLQDKRLALPTEDRIVFKEVKSILRCEGEINYTHFYFSDGTKLLISKTLAEYEEILSNYNFVRTHKTHLVNLMHVGAFNKSDGGALVLVDGSSVPVSRRRKEQVLEKLKGI